MRKGMLALLLVLLVESSGAADDAIVVIAFPGLPKADLPTVQRLYTGRIVSINQQSAIPVNLPPGHPVRKQFLETVLGQDEGHYTGYWLVRRYVGKGAPPLEVSDIDELIRVVQSTPGAVGYVPVSRLPRGANVIWRR
ncbi:hypothetical protein [Dechloromonas sp. A34]|uniref:hypothetical protein n=1 Tax=Dechloromonas sp. A34 TaxID=447588 RepID=UPI00224885C5|nr:hypothetical protein [Dechloromonas sp. A34]